MEVPHCSTVRVHHLMCLELKNFIDRISSIISAIESARPRNINALCSLRMAMDESNIVIAHCSEASKLYLASSADRILSRCGKIQNTLDLCLSQLQDMVPSPLAAQISVILNDIRTTNFSIDPTEHEAGKALLSPLRRDITASDHKSRLEFEALRTACHMLRISSPLALQMEKSSLRMLLAKIQSKDSTKKKILIYILYLLKKHGESILDEPNNFSIAH